MSDRIELEAEAAVTLAVSKFVHGRILTVDGKVYTRREEAWGAVFSALAPVLGDPPPRTKRPKRDA